MSNVPTIVVLLFLFFQGLLLFTLYTKNGFATRNSEFSISTIVVLVFAVLVHSAEIFHHNGGFWSICVLLYCIIALIIVFAIYYRKYGILIGNVEAEEPRPTDCLYLSVITWTTVGFGDIAPSQRSRPIAALEAIIGYCSMALLIASFIKLLGG